MDFTAVLRDLFTSSVVMVTIACIAATGFDFHVQVCIDSEEAWACFQCRSCTRLEGLQWSGHGTFKKSNIEEVNIVHRFYPTCSTPELRATNRVQMCGVGVVEVCGVWDSLGLLDF